MYSEHRKCIAACIEKRCFSGNISVSVSVTETARGRLPYEPHNNIGSGYQNYNG